MNVLLADKATLAGTRKREDGSLIADVRIARTGIQLYHGTEVGKDPTKWYKVYRPRDEVFSADTLKSAAHRPVTNDHPPEMVNADNWKKYAVGNTADEVRGEHTFIRVPLMVSDGAAIKDIEDGKREVSAGYVCNLDWTPGVTPEGEAYDAVQRNIRLNHVAIVDAGRAGPEVRIGDGSAKWGDSPVHPAVDRKEPEMDLRMVMVDGLSVQTTDQGAQAIDKLTKDRGEAQKLLVDFKAKYDTDMAAKDGELAKKDAEIDTLKKAQLTGDALDKLVAERSSLIAAAKRCFADVKTDGKSAQEIKRAVLEHVLGDSAKLADKSDAYIDARFDAVVDAAEDDDPLRAPPVRDADPQRRPPAMKTSDQAYQAMVDRQTKAWAQQEGNA